MGSLKVQYMYAKESRVKTGRLPESVLKRSVFRQFRTKRSEVIMGAGIGLDAAALKLGEDEVMVLSSDPVIWDNEKDGARAVFAACNDLACMGAETVGLLLTALLPLEVDEAQIRAMVHSIAEKSEPLGLQILGGHTEITSAVNSPIISVTGVGKALEERLISAGGVEPGDDIVVTKWIALEGTARIAQQKKDQLISRYPAYFIDDAAEFDRYMSILPEARLASNLGVHAMHNISEGGVFGALWELAECSGVGLEIHLKDIPLRQETVEICNYYELNPYQMISGGSLLLATADGNGLVYELGQKGIPASIIGKATNSNDRVILNEEERRFLERPQPDEIHKMISH